MLTLTRSVGERIYIGDDIVVEVRAILDGRQVRISIDAPRQVPIHRAEIFDAISRENRSAIASAPGQLDRILAAALPQPPAAPPSPAPPPTARPGEPDDFPAIAPDGKDAPLPSQRDD